MSQAKTEGPEVLFVSTWFPPMSGGPKNLYNHLKDFAPESYKILTSYFNFSWSEIDRGTWLNADYEFYDYQGGIDPLQEKYTVEAKSVRYRNLDRAVNLLRRFVGKYNKGRLLCAFLDSLVRIGKVFLATGSILKREKSISTLVTVSDMGWALIGTYLRSLWSRKDLVVYLFDLYADNYLLPENRMLAKIFEPLMMRRAKFLIVTNEETGAFYQKKYGPSCPPIQVVRNSSDSVARDYRSLAYQKKTPFRIVFAGHIYWPHEEAMENLRQAMAELHDLPLLLDMYVLNQSSDLLAKWASLKNVRFSKVPHSEISQVLQNAQLLLLPFSWNTLSPEIIRTASPAKLTDYLSAGTPILVHAPEWSYVAKFVTAQNCGFTATHNSPQSLAAKIREIFSLPEAELEQVGRQGVECFKREFAVSLNADRLSLGIAQLRPGLAKDESGKKSPACCEQSTP